MSWGYTRAWVGGRLSKHILGEGQAPAQAPHRVRVLQGGFHNRCVSGADYGHLNALILYLCFFSLLSENNLNNCLLTVSISK